MGQTTFLEMSRAVSDLIRLDIGLIERLGERREVAALFDLDGMWARDVAAKSGADMLAGLGPHERQVRDLALVVLPSPVVAAPLVPVLGAVPAVIAPGDVVLVEAQVTRVSLEHGALVVRIAGRESGLVTYTPVPLKAVRQVLAAASPR